MLYARFTIAYESKYLPELKFAFRTCEITVSRLSCLDWIRQKRNSMKSAFTMWAACVCCLKYINHARILTGASPCQDVLNIDYDPSESFGTTSGSFDQLFDRLARKESVKRPDTQLTWTLTDQTCISVQLYSLIVERKKPTSHRVYLGGPQPQLVSRHASRYIEVDVGAISKSHFSESFILNASLMAGRWANCPSLWNRNHLWVRLP